MYPVALGTLLLVCSAPTEALPSSELERPTLASIEGHLRAALPVGTTEARTVAWLRGRGLRFRTLPSHGDTWIEVEVSELRRDLMICFKAGRLASINIVEEITVPVPSGRP